jgi:flavodoxin I
MGELALFYGSSTGDTRKIAHQIASLCEECALPCPELFDVADYYLEEMAEFDGLLIGAPTWDVGQLQKDWQAVFDEFDTLDLNGKWAAIFGLGDQMGYPDTFADSLLFFADRLRERGATLIGRWPTEGYEFRGSWSVEEGRFVGLVLDEVNQPQLTEVRLRLWLTQLAVELGRGAR